MAYDPYQDIVSLLTDIKSTSGKSAAKAVSDLIKSNNSFYKSTYQAAEQRVKDTADYIRSGQAYRDEGAQAIRAAYADYADTARDHSAAAGAADNGGNLDSYAAAQANRSAEAMLTAGEQAVGERAKRIESALTDADTNAVNAAKAVIGALVDSADTLADSAKSAQSGGVDALEALLDYYGLLVRK